MKQTVVPAQVTTVEDKIAGNISFKQMLLLVAPVFLGGAMYVFLPPFLGYSIYKIVLWILFALVCSTLAVRIKGRLVVDWIAIRSKYNLRPTFYTYNKNSLQLRKKFDETLSASYINEVVPKKKYIHREVDFGSLKRLEEIILEPKANLVFHATKKGGLRVSIKEVK